MGIIRTVLAYITAVAITYLVATGFYTQQILAKQAEIGAQYTTGQQIETYLENFLGLTIYGVVLAIALFIGFVVAWGVKRVVRPLASIAYPVAGAAAVLTVILLVENQFEGAGAIGGARTTLGIALQCVAGAVGGFVFSLLRPHNNS